MERAAHHHYHHRMRGERGRGGVVFLLCRFSLPRPLLVLWALLSTGCLASPPPGPGSASLPPLLRSVMSDNKAEDSPRRRRRSHVTPLSKVPCYIGSICTTRPTSRYAYVPGLRRTGDFHSLPYPVRSYVTCLHGFPLRKQSVTEASSLFDEATIEETRESIDCKWACDDAEEERRLASMKLLLADAFGDVRTNFRETGIAGEEAGVQLAGGDGGAALAANPPSSLPDPSVVYPDVYGDARLLRFLRKDSKQDPASAAMRVRDFFRWRRNHDVDRRIRASVEEAPFVPPDELNVVSEYMPCRFANGAEHSTSGDLLSILYVGRWDTSGIAAGVKRGDINLSQFLDYWTYMYESINRQLYMDSVERRKFVYLDEVCDLSGTRLSQLSPFFVRGVLRPWLGMTEAHYPETTGKIIFFDPPGVLALAWKLITPMLSEGTTAKVRFCRRYDGTSREFVEDAKTIELNKLVDT